MRRALLTRLAEQRVKEDVLNKFHVSKMASFGGIRSVLEVGELCRTLKTYCVSRYLDDIVLHIRQWVIREYRTNDGTRMRNSWNIQKL